MVDWSVLWLVSLDGGWWVDWSVDSARVVVSWWCNWGVVWGNWGGGCDIAGGRDNSALSWAVGDSWCARGDGDNLGLIDN